MNLIIMGPQASGKGTQAKIISEKLNIPHISTGDIFREHLYHGTVLGKKVKEYLIQGHLVPDSLTTEIVTERLTHKDCLHGFILDGFPRTLPQATALNKMKPIDAVISIEVPSDICLKRISGRYISKSTGKVYNLYTSPKPKRVENDHGIIKAYDDTSGELLIQRDDDTAENAARRLADFERSAEMLKKYYKDILISIDGNRTAKAIASDISRKLHL